MIAYSAIMPYAHKFIRKDIFANHTLLPHDTIRADDSPLCNVAVTRNQGSRVDKAMKSRALCLKHLVYVCSGRLRAKAHEESIKRLRLIGVYIAKVVCREARAYKLLPIISKHAFDTLITLERSLK